MSISEYLGSLRQSLEILDDYGFAESIIYQEELRAGKQAIVNIEVVLVDGSRLIIREYLGSKYGFERLSYAYQYQDSGGNVIFRYDNAAHKPTLNSPNHRHAQNGEIEIVNLPDIKALIDEVILNL